MAEPTPLKVGINLVISNGLLTKKRATAIEVMKERVPPLNVCIEITGESALS